MSLQSLLEGHRSTARESSSDDRVKLPQCTRQPEGAGCTLSTAERNEVIRLFGNNVGKARQCYGDALLAVRMETLLEKDEDLPWFTSFLLDVTSSFLVGAIAKVGVRLGVAAGKHVHKAFLSVETKPGADKSALAKILDKGAESVGTKGKDFVKDEIKSSPAPRAPSAKFDKTGYLDELYEAAATSYTHMQNNMPSICNDEELLAMKDAFAPEHHTLAIYKAELQAKLARYMASGVKAIGRRHAARTEEASESTMPGEPTTSRTFDVVRDTRVAWHVYKSGFPTQLVFEHMDGETLAWPMAQFEEEQDQKAKRANGHLNFGPNRGIDTEAQTGKPVPSEFHHTAIARHEAMWGEKPRTVLVDDTRWMDPTRLAVATAHKVGGQ